MEPARDPLSADVLLGPVDVPAAYEVVLERLRGAIRLGAFGEGDALPPERELARRLGVSRVTLREALRVLEAGGEIRTRRGPTGGAVVLGVAGDAEEHRAQLVARIAEFDELVDFRVAVEGQAAALAAVRRTATDLEALAAAVGALSTTASVAEFRRHDSAFYLGIASAACNAALRDAIQDARERMFAPVDVLPYDVMVTSTALAHARVLRAIERGDGPAARRAMVAHLEGTHDELRRALGIG